jgi:hypothetical protein
MIHGVRTVTFCSTCSSYCWPAQISRFHTLSVLLSQHSHTKDAAGEYCILWCDDVNSGTGVPTFQRKQACSAYFSTLKMEAVPFSEASVNLYQTIQKVVLFIKGMSDFMMLQKFVIHSAWHWHFKHSSIKYKRTEIPDHCFGSPEKKW